MEHKGLLHDILDLQIYVILFHKFRVNLHSWYLRSLTCEESTVLHLRKPHYRPFEMRYRNRRIKHIYNGVIIQKIVFAKEAKIFTPT